MCVYILFFTQYESCFLMVLTYMYVCIQKEMAGVIIKPMVELLAVI